jgi:two-component system phosphate regulon sensor histidine kinase PhoR
VLNIIRKTPLLVLFTFILLAGYLAENLGMALLACVLITVVMNWFHTALLGPISQVKRALSGIKSGDYTKSIPIIGPKWLRTLLTEMEGVKTVLNQEIDRVKNSVDATDQVLFSITEGVITVDNKMNISAVNPAAETYLSIVETDVLGKPLFGIVRQTSLQDMLQNTINEKTWNEDTLDISLNQQQLHFQCHTVPLLTQQKELNGVLVFFIDITKRKKFDNLRKEFVANVSHELKTPITLIRGTVETLLHSQNLDNEQSQRLLKMCLRNSDRLDAIVNDLLSLSKIENKPENFEKVEFNLEETITHIIELCSTKAALKNIKIERESDSVDIVANQPLLEQAIINLTDNAIKYSPENSTVKLKIDEDNLYVRIHVIDQGQGISPLHHSRIFERFYRVDIARSRDMGGTGLGLAIVKHIVNLHKGDVTLNSDVGQGSEFIIQIPK